MQSIFDKQTTLNLASGKQESSVAIEALPASKPKNLASYQSTAFILLVAVSSSALVTAAHYFGVFSPLKSVLFGTRWTHTAPLAEPQIFISAAILFCAALISGLFIERSGLDASFNRLLILSLFVFGVGAAAAHLFIFDVLAIPILLTGALTIFFVQLRPILMNEKELSADIRRIAYINHLLEGRRADARMTSGLELLQTVLPLDEIVVFRLNKNGELTAAGRSNREGKKRRRKNLTPDHSEWREGTELCDQALDTLEPVVKHLSGRTGAARVAVPMLHENRLLGCLLVRFHDNYEDEDTVVLKAFASQLGRNFQRLETRRQDIEPRLLNYFSRRASEHRLESFRVVSGLLSEQQFASLAFGEMVEGYAIAYIDGTLAYFNRSMLKAAQITSDRARQLDLFGLLDRFKGGIFDEPRIAIRRVMQTGEAYRCEINFEDRPQTFDLQITLVHQVADGKAIHETKAQTSTPICFIVTVRDISAQKENEKLRSDMVSLMSHELRTPITSINGFAELLMAEQGIPEDSREFLRIISTESQRLSRMLNTFLAVSKLEQGDKREVIKIPIRLDAIAHEVLAAYQQKARKKRIRLVEQSNAHLPPVAGDKGLITKVVEHLVDNAIKYSPERTTVTVSSVLEADAVRVVIEDRGYGIPADALEKIWEKFYRVPREGQDKDETSTGLGLSFVKEVVEQHGGSVFVESEPNQGSKFSFTLPRL
jgi:signal transduction histidine kinase/small basic protein